MCLPESGYLSHAQIQCTLYILGRHHLCTKCTCKRTLCTCTCTKYVAPNVLYIGTCTCTCMSSRHPSEASEGVDSSLISN